MAISQFDSLIFFDGVAFPDGVLAFAAFPHRPGRPREAAGTRIVWFAANAWSDGGHLPIAAVGIAPAPADRRGLVALGRNGEVTMVSPDGVAQETLPGAIGPMRGVRNCGGTILAYGMNRQIYRRTESGAWQHWETGLPTPPVDPGASVAERIHAGTSMMGGINAIDTDTSGRLCAIGFRGEIYEWETSRWQPVDSMTNVILQDVRPAPAAGFYVCGRNGTILHSPAPHIWQFVEHDAPPSANFTSLAIFREKIYLADGQCLRLLDGTSCELLSMGVAKASPPSSRLFATHNTLLSVAGREIYRTSDGVSWETILQ
jgi:hypothetical protein